MGSEIIDGEVVVLDVLLVGFHLHCQQPSVLSSWPASGSALSTSTFPASPSGTPPSPSWLLPVEKDVPLGPQQS